MGGQHLSPGGCSALTAASLFLSQHVEQSITFSRRITLNWAFSATLQKEDMKMGIIWSENQYNMGPLKKLSEIFNKSRFVRDESFLQNKSEQQGEEDSHFLPLSLLMWGAEEWEQKSESKARTFRVYIEKMTYLIISAFDVCWCSLRFFVKGGLN